jgi:hypothetical protein
MVSGTAGHYQKAGAKLSRLHARRVGSEWRLAAAVTLAAVAAILADVSPLLRGPAPYPPEWRWDLRPASSGRWLPVLATGAALVLLAGRPDRLFAGRRRAAGLTAAVVFGWLFHLAIVGLDPAGTVRTLMDRALSRGATSYLTVAESEAARDPRAFVDRHAELLPGLRRHAATHPPGPVLFYRAFIGVFERAPAAADAVLSAAGVDPEAGRRPAAVRATALAAPLVLTLLAAAAAWPAAGLARGIGLDAVSSARVATLWPLVPGAALMAPHFDPALALPVTASAALLVAAASSERRRLPLAAAAGLLAGIALQASYGAGAFLAIAGAAALAGTGARREALAAVAAAAVAALAVVLLPMAWGHEPLAAARTALAIHRETYTRPRSYALWLAFNPLDLALFAGVPIVVAGAARLARARAPRGPFDRMRAALLAGIGLLFLSGAVRGEVGRIAAPLMPSLLVAALGPRGSDAAGPSAAEATLAGALLLLATLALAACWSVA